MKIASVKKEKASSVKPSPNTSPKVAMKFGQSSPSSKLKIVPVTTPTANNASMTFDQRLAIVRKTGSPVRSHSASMKRTNAGKAIPKQTSGMWTANESACICRASNRYSWSTGAKGAAASRSQVTLRCPPFVEALAEADCGHGRRFPSGQNDKLTSARSEQALFHKATELASGVTSAG